MFSSPKCPAFRFQRNFFTLLFLIYGQTQALINNNPEFNSELWFHFPVRQLNVHKICKLYYLQNFNPNYDLFCYFEQL